ncbi:hypothetical protein Tco_1354295 [Tanacetum coccineum]
MPYSLFTKLIINHFLSQYKSLAKLKHLYINTIKDDGVLNRLKFVRTGEDFQEYGRVIPNIMLTEEINQSKTYQTFLALCTSLIPPKKTIGKGSQGKKAAVTPKKKSFISADDNIIPKQDVALEPTSKRGTSGIVFRDTSRVSKKKSLDHSQKLKGIQVLTEEEQLAADTVQAIKSQHEEEEKQDDQDDDDDRSIDIKETNNDERTEDAFVHDNEEITDAEKTEATKGDYEQAGKLPPISSNLFVSSGFEVPQIQSPSLLKVPVLVIPEQATPTPSLTLPTKTPVLTVTSPPPIVSALSYVQQQITPIPTPPITTVAPSVTTTVLDPLPAIVQKVSELEKDIQGLKQVDHSPAILATIRS